MTQIALYDYLEQINRFLEDEKLTEAITHCRYVLRQYPRHVPTYRLLARALLENREFEDAAELFHRILSADPNDFVAHVGLAEIYRGDGELSEAVWHMERAFEMSPYDPTVCEILRDLYIQRDGKALSEIPLTRAALARLYFKGELYQEAATELRTILQQNGDDRVDLEVLLSEALWRANQRVDAVAVALKILERLPDSITVNAILGEVWLLTGRTEEAQGYLHHLLSLTEVDQKHLDPDSVVGQALQTDGAPSLPPTILVERWRTTADADKFDAGTRVGTEQPIEDEAVYDWLREDGGTDMLGALADEEDESDWFTDRLELPADQEESFAKTAQWLDTLGVEPESGDDFDFVADMPVVDESTAEGGLPPLADESLEWSEATADTLESDEFVQDWLSELDDTPVELTEIEEEQSDWFTSALAEEADETEEPDSFTSTPDDEGEAEEIDWFDEILTEDGGEVTLESDTLHTADLLSRADQDDLDWLVEEEAELPAKGSQELSELAEASFAEESLSGDELPNWLMEIGESPESFDFGEPEAEDKIGLFAEEGGSVGTGDLFASDVASESDDLEFNTADLLASASEGLPDWLTEYSPPEQKPVESGLSDTDLPGLLSEEDEAEQDQGSGLIRQMNRMMSTDELFADEEADDIEEEAEKPESEPLSLTGLLLGTAELADVEAFDDLDDETSDDDESAEKFADAPGLLGTAELLTDWGADVPDWLQKGGDQSSEQTESPLLQTTDLQGEELDEVPHWLLRDEEEPEEDKPKEQLPKPGARRPGLIGTAELFASLGEDVPDWISGTEEPEEDEEEPVGERTGLRGTADLLVELNVDLPDWAIDESEASGWQISDKERDEIAADMEEELWSLDEPPLDEAVADIVEEATPPTKSLLDWLSGEPVGDTETVFDEADEEELPDWLFSDTSQDEMEAVIMADNEQENNLEEMPDDSDDMDWLEELVAQDNAPDAGKRPTSAQGEGDMPDWLSNLTEPATDSEAALSEADDVPLTLTDSDLPDWLKDLGEATTPARPAISGSIENLPDWLKPPPDLDLGHTQDSDWSEPMAADASSDFADEIVGEDAEDLLGFDETDKSDKDDTSQIWLDAVAASESGDLESELTSGTDEELLDWLSLSGDDEAMSLPETADADEAEMVLDFLAETAEPDAFSLDDAGDDLDFDLEADDADWLSALAEEGEESLAETAEDDGMLDLFADIDTNLFDFDEAPDDDLAIEAEEEMPDWLMASAGTTEDALEADEDFADGDVEELPDWLVAAAASDEAEVEASAVAGDEADDLLPELGLDADDDFAFDDPMAWLDQLAVEQDELVEELPSVLDTSMYDTLKADEGEADLAEEMALPEDAAAPADSDLLAMLELDMGEADDSQDAALADELSEIEVEESSLSWLDNLDDDDDFDELPTMVVEAPDDTLIDFDLEEEESLEHEVDLTGAELSVAADEPDLDWLNALDESEAILAEEMETAVAPTTEDSLETVEVPDDLEEAMAWLDNLEAEEATSLEDLPTLDELVLMEELVDAEITADADEDEFGWLAELTAEEDEEEAVEDLPAVVAVEAEPEPTDPLQEALDRLEELALKESASFHIDNIADTGELTEVESLDDVLDWLEAQLASPGAGEPAETADEDRVDILEITTSETELILDTDTFMADETMDSVTASMDDQETAGETLFMEEVDFAVETPETTEADEMSDDDILAFMASILDDEDSFIPEKDVSFNPDDPDAVPSFALSTPTIAEQPEEAEGDDFVDVMADLSAEDSEEEVLAGMFDDVSDDMPDDIEAFMNAILGNEDSFIPEKDVSFNPDDPNALPSFITTQQAGDEVDEAPLSELPDDSDTTIAWLEDLEATQGKAEGATGVEDVDSILSEIDEDFAVGLFADVGEVAETADSQDKIEFDGTLADSLPDWLEFNGEERLAGHTDWLRSLPEPDVAGWLEAEEEVMSTNVFDEIPVPSEPEQPSLYLSGFEDLSASEPEDELLESEVAAEGETSVSTFSLNTGVLNKARQALAKGEYDRAMNQYRSLVEEGQGLSALIADLETAAEEYQQPLLRRLLGDAYMRNGQLQRALETYRIALDEL